MVATAMENSLAAMRMHTLSYNSTIALAALARLMHPGYPAPPAITFSTDSCTAVIQIKMRDSAVTPSENPHQDTPSESGPIWV